MTNGTGAVILILKTRKIVNFLNFLGHNCARDACDDPRYRQYARPRNYPSIGVDPVSLRLAVLEIPARERRRRSFGFRKFPNSTVAYAKSMGRECSCPAGPGGAPLVGATPNSNTMVATCRPTGVPNLAAAGPAVLELLANENMTGSAARVTTHGHIVFNIM